MLVARRSFVPLLTVHRSLERTSSHSQARPSLASRTPRFLTLTEQSTCLYRAMLPAPVWVAFFMAASGSKVYGVINAGNYSFRC